jgi:transcriptional regulator, pvuIIC
MPGGIKLSIENSIYLRNMIVELLRKELPVLRAKARISQEDIAEKIGISRQTYSSIETGKREMSWTTFLALIAYFQNNESTKKMIGEINGLPEGIEMIMESSDEIDSK